MNAGSTAVLLGSVKAYMREAGRGFLLPLAGRLSIWTSV